MTEYIGAELDLFATASAWKGYLQRTMAPYIRGSVLEVGAGIGATTAALGSASADSWLCLEPDARLAARIDQRIQAGELPARCEVRVGTIADMEGMTFDTILYVDVLEHIEDDRGQLRAAAAHLRPGGHLAVVAPAHQWLFSPFDAAIGHYRRYTKRSLQALTPEGLELVRLSYLDSAGLIASSANRLVIRSSMPTPRQISLWDRVLVPLSKRLDRMLGYSVGKSVLGVWAR